MKKFRLLLMIFTLISYVSCKNSKQETNPMSDIHRTILDSVFVSQSLQDSLSSFINDIDSFPNPYGPETVYSIVLNKGKDTTIRFYAYGLTVAIPPSLENCSKILGSIKYTNKIVSVIYTNTSMDELKNIINTEIFDTQIYEQYTYRDTQYDWDVLPSIREYKLTGNDSIVMIMQRKSKYEQ